MISAGDLAAQVTTLTAQVATLTASVTKLTADYNALADRWNKRVADKKAPKKAVTKK
jgi:outer membrane murein-binding lipoprotein Lpp